MEGAEAQEGIASAPQRVAEAEGRKQVQESRDSTLAQNAHKAVASTQLLTVLLLHKLPLHRENTQLPKKRQRRDDLVCSFTLFLTGDNLLTVWGKRVTSLGPKGRDNISCVEGHVCPI